MIGDWRDRVRTSRSTRSITATWQLQNTAVADAVVRLPGYRGPIHFRTGTSDAKFVRSLAWQEGFREYMLPAGFAAADAAASDANCQLRVVGAAECIVCFSMLVSKRLVWLVKAACSCLARPLSTCHMPHQPRVSRRLWCLRNRRAG